MMEYQVFVGACIIEGLGVSVCLGRYSALDNDHCLYLSPFLNSCISPTVSSYPTFPASTVVFQEQRVLAWL